MTIPNPVLNLDLSVDTATGSTTARTLANRWADVVNAKDYGVKADGVTDDTAALQAAINAAQLQAAAGSTRRLDLPGGTIITGPLTVAGQIQICGQHSAGTTIKAKTGTAAPVITVQVAGPANPGNLAYDVVDLRHLRITSADDWAGSASLHGLDLVTGTRNVRVVLEDVTICNLSGNGINTNGNLWGQLDTYDIFINNNKGIGVAANSCTDWHFYGGQIGQNFVGGMLLSGCAQFGVFGMNIYANNTYNLLLYSSPGSSVGNHQFFGCMFDDSNQIGVNYGLQGSSGALFSGCTFGNCSVSSPGTYSAVMISAGTNKAAKFSGCYWPDNHANDPAVPSKYALEFGDATARVTFDNLNYLVPGVLRTNAAAGQVATPSAIVSGTQYTGWTVGNGPNTIAQCIGFTASNDVGVLSVLSTGTVGAQLSANTGWAPNYIAGDLYIGNGASSATPTGYILRGTDGTGTNIGGAALTLAGGRGTGTAAGGFINLQVSAPGSTGATQNALQTGAVVHYNGMTVSARPQFASFSVSNGTNNIGRIYGTTAGNDSGVLALSLGGTDIVQLSAGNGGTSFINTPAGLTVGTAFKASASLTLAAPVTVAASSYTVLATDCTLILNPSAGQTLTLGTATAGRVLYLKLISAFAVTSASSNVVPQAGGAAGTAILSATAGKWATLQGDGTNWQILQGN